MADASHREHPFHGDYSSQRRRRCAFLSETRCFSLLRSQFPRAAGGRKDTFSRLSTLTVFHNQPVYLEQKKKKKRLVRSSSRRHRILFCGVELLKTQKTKEKQQQQQKKGISDGSSFPGSCAVTEENMGICGYLAVPGKCLVVLGLKLLFLVPAGVPARSGDSIFKDNITVRQGDSAVLK